MELKHVSAVTSMCLGLLLVFGTILALNSAKSQRPKQIEEHLEITITKEIEQPKQPKPQQPPKQTKQQPTPKLAQQFKGLDTELSGINLSSLNIKEEPQQEEVKQEIPPRPISRGTFNYPPKAKANRITGYVLLSVLVTEQGSVSQATVLEANPPTIFDAAALEGIKLWKFEPAKINGQPTKSWLKQKITFTLS